MDRVRDLVAAGGASVVLAQDRDRFAREPAYHYLLRRESEEHDTKVRALNARGDGSPGGNSPMGSWINLLSLRGRRRPRGPAGESTEGPLRQGSGRPPRQLRLQDDYALDRREPEKRERAREVLRRAGGAGTAALPAQVLSEFGGA